MAEVLCQIEQAQSGFNSTLQGPYGAKRGISCLIYLYTSICEMLWLNWYMYVFLPQWFMLTTLHLASMLPLVDLLDTRYAPPTPSSSLRPLSFIEEYLRDEVMPSYGNTHTTTSITSRQTTYYREEAR